MLWVLCIPCFDSYTFTNFVLQYNIIIGINRNCWIWNYLNFITGWWRKEGHAFMLLNFVVVWAQILSLLSTRLSSEVTILLSWKIMNNAVTKSFIIRNPQTIQGFCLSFYNIEFLQNIQGFLAHTTNGWKFNSSKLSSLTLPLSPDICQFRTTSAFPSLWQF